MKRLMAFVFFNMLAYLPASAWQIMYINHTNRFVAVNLGCVAMRSCYHLWMEPEQALWFSTKDYNGIDYIPKWLSAYHYTDRNFKKENEVIIVENQDVQDVNLCSGNRIFHIYSDRVTCEGGFIGVDFHEYLYSTESDPAIRLHGVGRGQTFVK